MRDLGRYACIDWVVGRAYAFGWGGGGGNVLCLDALLNLVRWLLS